MKKPNASPSPVVRSQVDSRQAALGKAERDLIRRHQAAAREIERWDMARELRPHTPALARDSMRMDEPPDVMKTIHALAGPGPRTASHPLATPTAPEPRSPMAAVVENIRMKPSPHFVDPHTIALAHRITVTLGLLLTFLAGLAVGKAL